MTGRLTWLGHATAVIELDGVRLVTDPVLTRRVGHLRRLAPPAAVPAGADAALVSHLHLDHLHGPSLRRLAPGRVVAPRGAARLLRRWTRADVTEVGAGDEVVVGALRVRAVPAAHDGRRAPGMRAFPALGYVVRGSAAVYFAGDTGPFAGMADLAEPPLDLALLPVAGWGPRLGPGHLGPEEAARALGLLRPRRAVPIHWGTYAPAWSTRAARPRAREPAVAFARAAARLAPAVDVGILAPGESAPLP